MSERSDDSLLDPFEWLQNFKLADSTALSRQQATDGLFGFYPHKPNHLPFGGTGGALLRFADALNLMTPSCVRPNCPRVGLLFDSSDLFFNTLEFTSSFLPTILSVGNIYSLHWVDSSSIQRHWLPGSNHRGSSVEEEDIKRKGHWHLDTTWAGRYDIVWALGCPGSITDLAARSLPEAVTGGGAPRLRCLLLLSSNCLSNLAQDLNLLNSEVVAGLKHLKHVKNLTAKHLRFIDRPIVQTTEHAFGDLGGRRRVGAGGYRERMVKLEAEANQTRQTLRAVRVKDYHYRLKHQTAQLRIYDVVYFKHENDRLFLEQHFKLSSLQSLRGLHVSSFKYENNPTSTRQNNQQKRTNILRERKTIIKSDITVFFGEVHQFSLLIQRSYISSLKHAFKNLINIEPTNQSSQIYEDVGKCVLNSTENDNSGNDTVLIRLLVAGSSAFDLIDEIEYVAQKAWSQMIEEEIEDDLSVMSWAAAVRGRWGVSPSRELPCLHIEYTSSSVFHVPACPITVKFISVQEARTGFLANILHQSTCIFLASHYYHDYERKNSLDDDDDGDMVNDEEVDEILGTNLRIINPLTFQHLDDWSMDIVYALKGPQTKVLAMNRKLNENYYVAPLTTFLSSLLMGVTRGYCLARARSDVAFSITLFEKDSLPQSNRMFHSGYIYQEEEEVVLIDELKHNRLWVAAENVWKLEVNFEFEEFDVGRDGSVCLFANHHLVTCILQPQLQLDLYVVHDVIQQEKEAENEDIKDYDIEFFCELRSSMYADNLRKSKSITLRLSSSLSSFMGNKKEMIEEEEEVMTRRRALPYDFHLSKYGDHPLLYVNDIETNEPIKIILDNQKYHFLKFTTLDEFQSLAIEFIIKYEIHKRMGMGCEKNDIQCMSKTLLNAIEHVIKLKNDQEKLAVEIKKVSQVFENSMVLKLKSKLSNALKNAKTIQSGKDGRSHVDGSSFDDEEETPEKEEAIMTITAEPMGEVKKEAIGMGDGMWDFQ